MIVDVTKPPESERNCNDDAKQKSLENTINDGRDVAKEWC